MVDVMELPRSRINASMLARFIDQPVCFVGRLEKVRVLAALGSPLGSREEGPRDRPGGSLWVVREGEGRQALEHYCAPDCFILHKATVDTLLATAAPFWRHIHGAGSRPFSMRSVLILAPSTLVLFVFT